MRNQRSYSNALHQSYRVLDSERFYTENEYSTLGSPVKRKSLAFSFSFAIIGREITPDDIQSSIPFCLFHKLLITLHLMLYISTSFVLYNFVYLTMAPKYSCIYQDPKDPTYLYEAYC